MTATTPLIDRKIFFGNPEIANGKLSPNGKQIAFLKEHQGILNLWVKDFDAPFEDATLLTKSKTPILTTFWSRDSEYLLYINDNNGDENYNIFAVNHNASLNAPENPISRNLTNLKEVTAQIYLVSKQDHDLLYIGLNDRDKAWHDLYTLNIASGELQLIYKNEQRLTHYYFDWDEQLRIVSRSNEDGATQFLTISENKIGTMIFEHSLKAHAYIAGWSSDNSSCYFVTNKGSINFSTLFTMNTTDGSLTKVESDPKDKVDFGGLWIDENSREVIATSYLYDKKVRYFKDAEWQSDFDFLQSKFEDHEIGFTSFTSDYSKCLVAVYGDRYASKVYCFDRKTKKLWLQYVPKPKLESIEEHLCVMQCIAYASSDGLTIPAYLTLPNEDIACNAAIILVHGGPKGPRDQWGYSGLVQFLANRGYAVLQPNFRASGGYGKAFLNAGDKQWGRLMQDDITYGYHYLVNNSIAAADKIGIMGGSYGGYATLAGLAFTPTLYACGIDIVGPSNLFTLLESIPPYWESGRKWLYEMVGDPATEEGQALLKAASPLFSVENMVRPLLIVQGANDPRVKQAESDQIVVALRDNGQPVTYLLALDEGHGFRKPLNNFALYAESERFLNKHLGGRVQEELSDDVRGRLQVLNQDVNAVKLTDQ